MELGIIAGVITRQMFHKPAEQKGSFWYQHKCASRLFYNFEAPNFERVLMILYSDTLLCFVIAYTKATKRSSADGGNDGA